MVYSQILVFFPAHQFNTASRGFSTRFDADLDMRMSNRIELSAYEILNKYEHQQLRDIFFSYGELRNAGGIAKAIIDFRARQPIKTTSGSEGSHEKVFAKTEGEQDNGTTVPGNPN